MGELRYILSRQQDGPIVYVKDQHPPSLWTKFLELKRLDRLQHLKRVVDSQKEEDGHRDNDEEEGEEQRPSWSWRKLLSSVFGDKAPVADKRREEKGRGESPDSCNLYDKKADYSNDYGYSKALDESNYDLLKSSGIGIYLVNLTAVPTHTYLPPHFLLLFFFLFTEKKRSVYNNSLASVLIYYFSNKNA